MNCKKLITLLTFFIISPPFLSSQTLYLDAIYGVDGPDTRVDYKDIIYGTGAINGRDPGEKDLLLDLYRPTGNNLPAQLPGIVLIHGGSFIGGSKEEGTIVNLAKAYASCGYIAVSIEYRLVGDDPDFLQLLGDPRYIAADDAVKSINWMIENSDTGELCEGLITDKIAIGGTSAGAITALTLVLNDSPTQMPGAVLAFWGALRSDNPPDVFTASTPPIFIMHGTADTTVPFSQTAAITQRCEVAGVDYELFAMAEEDHFSVVAKVESAYVDGKNMEQQSIDFCYDRMGLASVTGIPFAQQTPTSPGIDTTGDQISFHFPTKIAMDYDVFANSDLTTPVASWPILSVSGGATSYNNLPSGGNGTLVLALPDLTAGANKLFFVADEVADL
ncbi:MAG: alpha/beta hydrolase [Verrucomicrobiota bacterium]